MKTFQTSDAVTWSLGITMASVKRLKGTLDIDLLKIESGKPPLVTRLAQDIELFCNVLVVLIQPQAKERGVTDEQFGELLGGDAIQAAYDTFWEELTLFFQSLKRTEVVRLIQKQFQLIQAGINEVTARVDLIDPEAEIQKHLPPRQTSIPGNGSTSSPALSESTPPP